MRRSAVVRGHHWPLSDHVWALYDGFIASIGPRPTLIERDGNLPPFAELLAERNRAQQMLEREPACV